MGKWTIYNEETSEEYIWGYNHFTAINNLSVLRSRYGEVVKIKWEEPSNDSSNDKE